MKIILSIADIPFNIFPEELFQAASKIGFDGVEVLLGIKTFSPIKYLEKLSSKYSLPILSIHHPFWALSYITSSDKAFKTAQHFNALMVVHPLASHSINSPKQQDFLHKIELQSKKYHVEVALENMPKEKSMPVIRHISPTHTSTTNLSEIYLASKKHNFNITLDTCHLKTPDITKIEDYKDVRPLIKNVHLSDYDKNTQHLALGEGSLNSEKLIKDFIENKYEGLITLELSPRLFCKKEKYFKDIKKSFEIVKRLSTRKT